MRLLNVVITDFYQNGKHHISKENDEHPLNVYIGKFITVDQYAQTIIYSDYYNVNNIPVRLYCKGNLKKYFL